MTSDTTASVGDSDADSFTSSGFSSLEYSSTTKGTSSVVSNQSSSRATFTAESEGEEISGETSSTELMGNREAKIGGVNGSLFQTLIQAVNKEARRLHTHDQGDEGIREGKENDGEGAAAIQDLPTLPEEIHGITGEEMEQPIPALNQAEEGFLAAVTARHLEEAESGADLMGANRREG